MISWDSKTYEKGKRGGFFRSILKTIFNLNGFAGRDRGFAGCISG